MGWYYVEILQMLEEGRTPEEVIEYYGQPEIVNDAYIRRIIKHDDHHKKPNVRATMRKPKMDPPGKDTNQYKVWDWASKHGGVEIFKELYRTKEISAPKLAQELGVSMQTIINFNRDYTGNYRDRDPFYGKNKCLGQIHAEKNRRRWIPKDKRKKNKSTEQKLRDLF